LFSLNIEYYIFAIIIVYIPFHLFEEAMGNFPLWMKEHRYMPEKKTYGFWMAGNLFFYYPLLLTCALISLFTGERFISTGLAVLIWGGLNFVEHFFFTLKDKKVCPGLYTSVLFIIICIIGLYRSYQLGLITPFTLTIAIIIALICAILPGPLLQKYVGNKLWKDF
jgi:hypothetical protein